MQKWLKFSDCRKSIGKQIWPSVEKPSDLILCLFGFLKATILEFRANIRSAFRMFWERVASLVKFYTNQKNFLLSAERPRYKFSATVLCRICKQRSQ